jgi:hypothetical protein
MRNRRVESTGCIFWQEDRQNNVQTLIRSASRNTKPPKNQLSGFAQSFALSVSLGAYSRIVFRALTMALRLLPYKAPSKLLRSWQASG